MNHSQPVTSTVRPIGPTSRTPSTAFRRGLLGGVLAALVLDPIVLIVVAVIGGDVTDAIAPMLVGNTIGTLAGSGLAAFVTWREARKAVAA